VTPELTEVVRPVDRTSPLPAWAQVHADLRRIIDHTLGGGEKLPTERDLAELYGISRITMRQALSALADDGYVQRRQGLGTFVSDRPRLIQHDLGLLTPWRDRMRAAGADAVSVHLRDSPVEFEPVELSRELSDAERSLDRLHLKRLHLVDAVPIGITDSWMVGRARAALRDTSLIDGSVTRSLEAAGIFAVTTEHFLEVRTASPAEARLLNSGVGAALFVNWSFERADAELLSTTRSVWAGEHVRFHFSG
jgi:GntR family transcriptional regulator